MNCLHAAGVASVEFLKIEDTITGQIVGYRADLSVKCKVCGLQFHFSGDPTVSPDGTTVQLPMTGPAPVQVKAPNNLWN